MVNIRDKQMFSPNLLEEIRQRFLLNLSFGRSWLGGCRPTFSGSL